MFEFNRKIALLRKVLKNHDVDGILITKQKNCSWLFNGRYYVNIATEKSVCFFLVTKNKIFIIGPSMDVALISDEEIKIKCSQEIERIEFDWFDTDGLKKYLNKLEKENKYAADSERVGFKNLSKELLALRTKLSQEEQLRYKELGLASAIVLEDVVKNIKYGQSELEVAAILHNRFVRKEIDPLVVLIGSDNRAEKYRHPLPTKKLIKKYAVVSICTRKDGLITSATRSVHLGKISTALKKKHQSVTRIDAELIRSTKIGYNLNDILEKGINAYKKEGFKDEWKLHFQGGLTGYSTREKKVNLFTKGIVEEGNAFAWNPTITGVKSEDTFLINKNGEIDIITQTGEFPYLEYIFDDFIIYRPGILTLM